MKFFGKKFKIEIFECKKRRKTKNILSSYPPMCKLWLCTSFMWCVGHPLRFSLLPSQLLECSSFHFFSLSYQQRIFWSLPSLIKHHTFCAFGSFDNVFSLSWSWLSLSWLSSSFFFSLFLLFYSNICKCKVYSSFYCLLFVWSKKHFLVRL